MKDIDKITSWYEQRQSLFKALAGKVADILKENIEGKHLEYHSITKREKSLDRFTSKAKKEKYTDPMNQIKDMAGIRVITYLENNVSAIAEITEALFDIDWDNSYDQSKLLGSDRLGYRSVHYVAKFDKTRCKLPEYERYKELPFEIQIRSLLQHAWAEFAHDRNYKFGGKLPTKLERRLNLVAGTLEIADHEFEAIAAEIDRYETEVKEDLLKGDLDIEITTVSLTEYLSNKFSRLAKDISEDSRYAQGNVLAKTIVEELRLFGISTLAQLDKIVPSDLEDQYITNMSEENFAGIVRDILMINDTEKYFEVSWRGSWQGIHDSAVELLTKYGVDPSCLERHEIDFLNPDI